MLFRNGIVYMKVSSWADIWQSAQLMSSCLLKFKTIRFILRFCGFELSCKLEIKHLSYIQTYLIIKNYPRSFSWQCHKSFLHGKCLLVCFLYCQTYQIIHVFNPFIAVVAYMAIHRWNSHSISHTQNALFTNYILQRSINSLRPSDAYMRR